MKPLHAIALYTFTILSLASCSMEKRLYSKGYHISWHTFKTDAWQGCSKGASQNLPKDLSSNLSQNLETVVSQDLSSNLSLNLETDISQDLSTDLSKKLEIDTKSDTITPSNKEEDYFGQKDYSSDQKEKTPFFSHPIRRPKTIQDLKVSIGRDFKLALLSILIMAISLGFIYLISLASPSGNGQGVIFFVLALLASIFTFIFYLTRGIIRTFKLSALKVVGKSDDTEINKNSKSQPIRESEGQYSRRFLLAIGRFFRSLLHPSSFGAKVLLYLMALIVGALIIGLSQ